MRQKLVHFGFPKLGLPRKEERTRKEERRREVARGRRGRRRISGMFLFGILCILDFGMDLLTLV